ncbi:TIGR04222 domain-containing membrane protein [Streptomyces sp. NPDC051567]|uniref:TIGR04222 domain-containing membrane protein n=1 Tax=Streptomyces sp. NPDC051567 TaxID=3365660 RepID=UPI0037BB113E
MAVPLLGLASAHVPLHRRLYPRDRPERADRAPLTLYEAAYLHRGRPGVAEVALTALHLAGRLPAEDEDRPSPGRSPAGAAPPDDPLQAAALGLLATTALPHLDGLRILLAHSPAVTAVEDALVGRGLAVDPRLRRRVRRVELARVLSLVAVGPMTVAACWADTLGGQGNGSRPLVAFLTLVLVTVVLSRFSGPARPEVHATETGRRRGRETSVDETWAPWLAPGVPIPAAASDTLVRVAREGVSRHDGSAPLAARLSPLGPARPPTRRSGASGFSGTSGAGCGSGGGCGGGG